MNSLWMDVEHSVAKFGNFIYIQYIYKKVLIYTYIYGYEHNKTSRFFKKKLTNTQLPIKSNMEGTIVESVWLILTQCVGQVTWVSSRGEGSYSSVDPNQCM